MLDIYCEPEPGSWAEGKALTHGDVTQDKVELSHKRPVSLQLEELSSENRAAPLAWRRLCPFVASGGPSPYLLLDVPTS